MKVGADKKALFDEIAARYDTELHEGEFTTNEFAAATGLARKSAWAMLEKEVAAGRLLKRLYNGRQCAYRKA